MRRRSFALALLLPAQALTVASAFGAPAHAASAPALTSEQQAMVDRATACIKALRLAKGRFTQIDGNGATSTGEFYISRPGRARFEYDAPAQLLVVSDGHNVSIYDRRLKSFDQYPLGSTPLVLLLAKEVRLDHGAVITAVEPGVGGFSITAKDARRKAEGRIMLLFGDDPVSLKGWTIVDGQGQETRVRLGEMTPVSDLDPGLFVLKDPRAHAFGRP